jgi:hypothetical protein
MAVVASPPQRVVTVSHMNAMSFTHPRTLRSAVVVRLRRLRRQMTLHRRYPGSREPRWRSALGS